MTDSDAFAFRDFLGARIMGWDIVLASGDRGRIDGRTRQARLSGELMRDLWLNLPDVDELHEALKSDEDIALLWPAELQEAIRFRLWHSVPRAINEPLSEEGVHQRQVMQGLPAWPDFLQQYSNPATWRDHPPFPAHSAVFVEMEKSGHGREA